MGPFFWKTIYFKMCTTTGKHFLKKIVHVVAFIRILLFKESDLVNANNSMAFSFNTVCMKIYCVIIVCKCKQRRNGQSLFCSFTEMTMFRMKWVYQPQILTEVVLTWDELITPEAT